ncbi:MAG: hypothetical protein K9I25_08195 [Crocinitomicaceae bacterium]|nr:hypothetical protein [Crocinitomicaceae bacterium]
MKIIADFDTYATAYYSACSIPRGLSAPKGCIEGHITTTAGFDTLRYSACL